MSAIDKKPMNPKFTITNGITAALTRIERARGFLEHSSLTIQDYVALCPNTNRRTLVK